MLQHGNLLKYFDLIKQNIVKAVVQNDHIFGLDINYKLRYTHRKYSIWKEKTNM